MNLIKKYKFLILIIAILLTIVSAVYYNSEVEEIVANELVLEVTTSSDSTVKIKKLKVDIKGSIKKPGVYEIIEGSRVIDVIEKSGGFNNNAYTSNINLSKILNDEDVIIIYSNEEIENIKKGNIEYIEKECPIIENKVCDCQVTENIAYIKKENIATNIDIKDDVNKIININTAIKEELMTLSGIGESKADSIIEYRINTKFKSIEELKSVKGIGESIYEKIKDFIKV